jgi:integrase
MASILTRGDGRRAIQFQGLDGKRKTVGLGKATVRDAQAIRVKIEAILASQLAQRPFDPDVAKWIAQLAIPLANKLAEVGLLCDVAATEQTDQRQLKPFLDAYVARRKDVKGGTRVFYNHTIRNLLEFFGPDRPLSKITLGDADDFRRYLQEQRLSASTVCRRSSLARTFFRDAVRRKLIPENPFADLKTTTRTNAVRQRYIPKSTIQAVIEACQSAEWRLLIALSRFAGLRVPSEVMTLRWENVDWDGNRMTVYSPKTEHHEGKESRVVPIFPELRPYLEEVLALTRENGPNVFQRLRKVPDSPETGWRNINLRTSLMKIIKRAGFEPWPKLWHNLRASAETDLAEEFPMHVVCKW